MSIFDAAMRYAGDGTPLVVLAGKEYGSGTCRDWAAKGPFLLGVRAVIAESYERIHRSNLVGMGILPLQYLPGESAPSLGLTGRETLRRSTASPTGLRPRQELTVTATDDRATSRQFRVVAAGRNVTYLEQGGVLQTVPPPGGGMNRPHRLRHARSSAMGCLTMPASRHAPRRGGA